MAKLTSFLLLSLFFSAALADVDTFNNDWYQVSVDDVYGYWAAATGPLHPGTVEGQVKEILYGGVDEEPGTVYFTVYSNTTGQTYTNDHNLEFSLGGDDLTILKVSSVDSTGLPSTYVTNFVATFDDGEQTEDFTVKITYKLVGTTFSDAAILFTTEIENTGAAPISLILRWQMDYNLMGDDGCAFATVTPDSGRYIFEKEWATPSFDQYLISPNGLSTAFYEAYGPVTGPAHYIADPTVPSKVQFASYTANTLVPFNTAVNTSDQVVYSSNIQDDSVVMLYFQPDGPLPVGQTFVAKSAISSLFVDSDNNGVIVCDDGWACTYDHIAVQAGHVQQCLHIPQHYYCDDNKPCTIDSCEQNNLAQWDEAQFDEASGCLHLPKDCSDGIFCTDDSCDEETGDCKNEATDCNDHIACTNDECNEDLGGCVNTPDDDYCNTEGPEAGNLCLNIWCDEFEGCQHEDKECDDQIGCTDNRCDPEEGCYFEAVAELCADNVTCTIDRCDKNLGKCVNEADDTQCPPVGTEIDLCMDYFCDVIEGCLAVPKVCDGPDTACLFHKCISGQCVAFAMDHLCNDTLYCTDERCSPELGKCESIPNDGNCDDGDWCTLDYCDPIKDCQTNDRVCDDGIVCTTDSCNSEDEKCDFDPVDSLCNDDGKTCTVDTCHPEKGCLRFYNNSACNDDDPCTEDYCWGASSEDADGCVHIPMVCDDDVHCTDNVCVDGECTFPEKLGLPCDDGIYCTEDVCDADGLKRCVNTPLNSRCDDSIDCTVDWCDAAEAGDGCHNVETNSLCDDGFACTLNWCDASDEVSVKGCQIELKNDLCDDNINCTIDECTATAGCTFTPDQSKCEDDIECTINTCGENGCEVKLDHSLCDDGIECTENVCTASGCHYPPRNDWCNDDVACTEDICNATLTGGDNCVHIARHERCDDGRACSIEVCDLADGCLIEESNCAEDEDCEHCVNCKSGLSRLVADDLEDGSGDLLIMTRNYRVLPYTVASSTKNLTENLKIKGSGAIVLGDVEHLSADDGLVIGQDSSFRLVPSQETSAPACNELNRGLIRVVEETSASTSQLVDHMYICLASVGSYEWKLLN